MNNQCNLAPHEIIELRELIDNSLIGAKKVKSTLAMVEDDGLKSLMEQCLHNKKENINSIQTFIENNMNIE